MGRFRATVTALFMATIAVAGFALLRGWSTPVEAVGFVTGALCVWLTAKENIWNWPIGLLNAAASAVVYFQQRLFNDGGLQIIYFVLGMLGWYWWLHGGEQRSALKIDRTPAAQWAWLGLISTGAITALTYTNYRTHDAAPFLDASTTVVSLVAQYLLTRKYLENWLLWIAVDLVYVPLLLWKGLYLFALLYAIFTFMAVAGFREWARLRADQRGESERPPLWRPTLVLIVLGLAVWGWMGWIVWKFESFFPGGFLASIRWSEEAKLISTRHPDKERAITGETFTLFKAEVLDPLVFREFEDDAACCENGVIRIPAYHLSFPGDPPAVFVLDPFGRATVPGAKGPIDVRRWLDRLPKEYLFEP